MLPLHSFRTAFKPVKLPILVCQFKEELYSRSSYHLEKTFDRSGSLPVEVELGKATVSVREMLSLDVGDVVKLDQLVEEPLTVKIGKEEKYLGFPGLSNNKLAVQLYGIKQKGGEHDVK